MDSIKQDITNSIMQDIYELSKVKFEYENKPRIDQVADFAFLPLRYLLNGRDIKMLTPSKEKQETEFKTTDINLRYEVNNISYTCSEANWKSKIKKIVAFVFVVPGLFLGTVAKYFVLRSSSRLNGFAKVIQRYRFTYTLGKKNVQQKLDFQLKCAREHQRKQRFIDFPYLSDEQNQINEAKINESIVEDFRFGEKALNAVAVENQGFRSSMEDAHLATEFSIKMDGKTYSTKLYGVFDGHVGSQAAHFMKAELEKMLTSIMERNTKQPLTSEVITNAITEACVRLDIDFRKLKTGAGTTVTFAWVINDFIYTANIGDSRTILVNPAAAKEEDKIVQLTEDADMDNDRFRNAITKAGGEITLDMQGTERVNGLACPRDIGLTNECLVSPQPKITCVKAASGSVLVIACDGIWDVMTTEQVGSAVLGSLAEGRTSFSEIAEYLVAGALIKNSKDNLSAMLVRI